MGKLPFMKFFPGDFDRDMSAHPLEIRGAWISIIDHLWFSEPRGRSTHSFDQWARVLGSDEETAKRIIDYLLHNKIADCNVECNGNVTVVSRRIEREEKDRENTKLRVDRFRKKSSCNADVTPLCNGNVTPKKLEVRSQKSEKDLTTSAETYSEKAKNSIQKLLNENREIWHEAYPAINLETETAKALSWLLSNPKNKKSDFKRFLNNWMLRAQDKAPRVGAVGKPLTLKEIVAREGL
jgi:hypothetical protein